MRRKKRRKGKCEDEREERERVINGEENMEKEKEEEN